VTRHATALPGGSTPGSGSDHRGAFSGGRAPGFLRRVAVVLLSLLCVAMLASASASADAPTFDSSFDGSGTPAGSFGGLGRIAVDQGSGDVYVMDTGNNVIDRFSSSGSYVSQLDGTTTTAGSFSLSGDSDITVDNSGGLTQGNVYVASENQNALFAFDPSGSFLWEVDGFNDSCGVAVNSTGNVWVDEFNTSAAKEFDSAGIATGNTIDMSGQGSSCHMAFDSSDNLYAALWNGATDKYDSSGSFVSSIDPNANRDVATDSSNGDVYLEQDAQVAVYDSSGTAVSGTPFGSGTIGGGPGVTVNGVGGRVYVADGVNNLVQIFDLGPVGPQPPAIAIGAVTNLTKTSATINGTVNAKGDPTTCQFEWGATTAYGNVVACPNDPGSGTSPVDESADLSGLTLNTTYHYRLVATNGNGTTTGSDQTFTTLPDPPVVTTGAASGITQTEADIAGTVDPSGAATTCAVEYGTTTAYGSTAPCASDPGSGTGAVPVDAPLSGLDPGTTYHYRMVATNAGGTVNGDDATFDTAITPPVVFSIAGASSVTQTAAHVAGTVNPKGNATTCQFEYGTTTGYGSVAPCTADPGSGTHAVSVSADVTGLTVGTAYHFRLVATNPGGTTQGDDHTFSTLPDPPVVTTGAASGVTQSAASLAGTVNPSGVATTCQFEYGTTTAYGSTVPCSSDPGSGTGDVAVDAAPSGLSAGTTYHYRLVATNDGGTTNGDDQTFDTVVASPTVTTGAASEVTQTSATVAGTVDPNGGSTTCRFEYGTTTAYGSSVLCSANPGSGPGAVPVGTALSGLSAGTTYHYRLVATNDGGTTNGADATLTTSAGSSPPPPPPPAHGKLALSVTKVKRGKTTLTIACRGKSGAVCKGKLKLSFKVKHGKKTKTVTIATITVNLTAGHHRTVKLTLPSSATKVIKKSHRLKVTARGPGIRGTVTLK
jgi:phosphodiesterase/alkaline phosphatase D-like protein